MSWRDKLGTPEQAYLDFASMVREKGWETIKDLDPTGLVFKMAKMLDKLDGLPGTILQVPYLSQWGIGADVRRGDCGPACVAMLTHYMTTYRPTVDQAADACGQPDSGAGSTYTGHAQLRQGASAYGFGLATRSKYVPPELSLELIISEIDKDTPVIALIHYGVLRDLTNDLKGPYVSNQDQNYKRGHWVVVVGYDNHSIYINDPDYWGGRAYQGDHRRVPLASFEAALKAVAPGCTVGNQGLVIQ